MNDAAAAVRSLYVHVPFCERKCEYCDFTSVAGLVGAEDYVEALCREIHRVGTALNGAQLHTIFFGGGTPGLIDPVLLQRLLATVRNDFDVAPQAEITLEANPSSTSVVRAQAWRAAGFNRVSLGIQSLEPDILAFLGRVHDAQRAVGAVAEVRTAGFDNVNCDLIYAVPGLDDARWQLTLERVMQAAPDHVSAYELTVEPGTPLHTSVARGDVRVVDPEIALRQHWMAVNTLASGGYTQYEVSNFSRNGKPCSHNLTYWRNEFYAAVGVGAHGHLPPGVARTLEPSLTEDCVGFRYWHTKGIRRYLASVNEGHLGWGGSESVSAEQQASETLMMGLRLAEGVVLDEAWGEAAEGMAQAGLLVISGRRVRTTSRGQEVLNEVVARLVA